MPLHIFEPRYLHLVLDALAQHRLIGMVQPRKELIQKDEVAPLYRTGCAGRICYFEEMPEGRLMIALQGVSRFYLAEELPIHQGYRRGRVDWLPFMQDLSSPHRYAIDLPAVMSMLRRYIAQQNVALDIKALEGVEPHLVVNALSVHLPFSDGEKQALLESATDAERALLLLNIMEMECHMPSASAVRQ